MFAWLRSKMKLLARFGFVAACVGSTLFPMTAVHAADTTAPRALTGLITPVGTINPVPASSGLAPLAPALKTQLHTRGAKRVQAQRTSPNSGTIAAAGSGSPDATLSGALRPNFNGVGSLDSAVTNFGAEFEPPDQGLCVGNGVVLEPVNSAYTFYRTNGSAIAGQFNVNVLFGDGLAQFTSDPRCYYDRATNRWFAIILFIADDNLSARTDIAVSTSGDPTRPWTIYHLDATDDGTNGTPSHPGCPCLGDQPLLGVDSQNLYVSTNEFSILGPEANGAQVYAIAKSELVAGATAHFVMFENLTIGGTQAFSVQPALTSPDANAEYFLNSLDPNGTGDNRLGVWALTDRQAVAHGGVPTLSKQVIKSEAYGIPPGAAQKGSTSLLDAGDDRMQQTQFINGELWGALDTVVSIANDASPRAGIAWFRVHPTLANEKLASANIAGQGYLSSKGNYLLYPAIQSTPDGLAGVVFTVTGPNMFASAAFAVMAASHNAFGNIHIAAAGTGPYDANATRWGDYSFAVADPGGNGIWFATEYIPPQASQTTDGRRNWGTRVFQVSDRDA